MKKIILPLFALITYGASAQFSIVPQLGMETFRTTIQSGDFASFSPMGQQFTPSLAIRMAYRLKSGQGAFLGVATNRQAVAFRFTDPQNALNSYTAAAKNLQLRLEGGYQFTSKPIALRKAVTTTSIASRYGDRSFGERKQGCARSRCSGTRSSENTSARSVTKTTTKDAGLYVSIKPSAGLAIAPMGSAMETETKNGQKNYTYRAGWGTALIAGTAFEFGTRDQPKFIVGINYIRGLGNNTQTVTTNELLKPTTTTFSSKTSGFNVSLGIPISFKKKAAVIQAPPPINRPSYRRRCGQSKLYQL